ncbi:MAG: aminotransferase class IV [Sedimentisphaerales bacterium]|nr:aminotransferase class IV [Sedimentisphaerales bacterium]
MLPNMDLAMINDEVTPLAEARISIHDRSIYFGDGVYEAVRCCGGRLFAMEQHLERLKNSLRKMDMLARVDLEQVRRRVARAVSEAAMAETLVYFQISRGAALRNHDYLDDWQPCFLLTIRAYHDRREQATVITHPDWRWKKCDIKSLNLLPNVLAKHAATKADAYEALLVDESGLITEATSSNALLIKGDVLRTAPLTANILPGITRAIVLGFAGQVGLQVREKSFTVGDALAADELLVTGTGNVVMGVTHIDGKPVANGKVGPYTQQLHKLLIEAMK